MAALETLAAFVRVSDRDGLSLVRLRICILNFHALAVDYDGTLARDGLVDESTVAALQQLKSTGRHLVLVTGRRLEPLQELFPEMKLFDQPSGHFVVSFCRVAEDERPKYFDRLLHELSSMRSQKGRPHWIIVDEAKRE